MAAPDTIANLVDRFRRNESNYKSDEYKEAEVRAEFLNPFFEALGWDIYNQAGYAEAYKDVVHEPALQGEGAPKAPDYSFRIGGRRKFFAEAKRPGEPLKTKKEPALQLRSYAWTAGLPLSILTDFEEFAAYDCRIKPKPRDKASTARIMYFTADQYVEQWDDIESVFSKQAVLRGSFDRYADSTKTKRGTAEFDDDFLAAIEHWREILARNLALRNKGLSTRQINEAVQLIIDRVVFLRICEDRGMEEYGQLREQAKKGDAYDHFMDLCAHADNRYNSGLFHFRKEKGRSEPPDTLTPDLTVDDGVLKEIAETLYWPKTPYAFNVVPADILGQVYERFLGNVIRLTPAHRAKVEQKPEVRKQGGVFYTPTYIVRYIVKQAVGKLVEGRKPQQVEKLNVLDPACGSGSFLLEAYQYLLDWHLSWYVANHDNLIKKHRERIRQVSDTEWRLTTGERKRILLANIHGVDVDPQAVEVTKLSLLLKVLEGETQESIDAQMKLFHERALPDLGENVKCGNSLVGPDFFVDLQEELLEDDLYRLNPFDWDAGFPEVWKAGGFDAIIGNPPYIPIELMADYEREYYAERYPQVERKYDTSELFTLAMLPKLSERGRLGFISSQTWQTGENFAKVREHIFENYGIEQVVNLPFDVFKDAYVDTGIFILTKAPQKSYQVYSFPKKEDRPDLEAIPWQTVPVEDSEPPEYKVILNPAALAVTRRAEQSGFVTLGEITESTQGLHAGAYDLSTEDGPGRMPFLADGQVYRYVLEVNEIQYADMRPHQNLVRFYQARPKVLIRRVINRQDRLMATYSDRELVTKKDINPFASTAAGWDAKYLLAIVNSALISFLYVTSSAIATKDDFRQTTLTSLRQLPIPEYSSSDSQHTRLVNLVDDLLAMDERAAAVGTHHERDVVRRQAEALDLAIDEIVFDLYSLTDEERAVVMAFRG